MLYDTHKRYGQVSGILMLPFAVDMGVMEFTTTSKVTLNSLDVIFINIVLLFIYVIVAIKSSMFGAEFPDCDSPGSTPAQKHPIIAKLFRKFGVKHRGKFSHDFMSQAVFWGLIYGFIFLLEIQVVSTTLEMILFSIVKVFVFFSFIGVYSHLLADAMTTDGVWFAGKIKIRFMPVFIRKFNLFGWKPFKSWFTTASIWNDMNYKFMTVMVPFSALFSLLKLIFIF